MLTAAQRRAYESVRRACYAGLESVALRQEIARRAALGLPVDGCAIGTLDPEFGLLTHCVVDRVPADLTRQYLLLAYPQQEAARVLELGRSGRVVSTAVSPLFAALLRSVGLTVKMRAVFAHGGMLWGSSCFFRETGSRPFTQSDQHFVRRIAPHVARGLRRAALLDAARTGERASDSAEGEGAAPGVVVLDACGRLALHTAPAARYLADLADVGTEPEELPLAVGGALAQLRWRQRHAETGEPKPLESTLAVRGRGGRWYALHAMLTEPDSHGDTSVVVVLVPSQYRERSGILARLYGLSPRERDVLARVVRGESTKQIAAALGLSVYTVQDHVDSACIKVGVRGRRALLAKLFFDGQPDAGRGDPVAAAGTA